MSALLKPIDNIVEFKLPKKPRIKEKEYEPYEKAYCITPFRAAADKRLHEGTLRVLMMLCSYTNRAGITWVGQAKLGERLGITKQAVNKQMKLLQELGYIEVVSKGFRAERANTTRVIFDPNITAEDAIAIVSPKEDARPPHMIEKEMREMEKQFDNQREQARKGFREMVRKMTTMDANKIDTSEKPTDSITVREMKQKIKKVQTKTKKTVDNSSHSQLHSQPDSKPLEVDQLVTDKVLDKVINKDLINSLINKNIKTYKELVWSTFKIERQMNEQDLKVMTELVENGLTEQMWIDVVTDILQTMRDKRQDPPHRIGYFRDGLMQALSASHEYL